MLCIVQQIARRLKEHGDEINEQVRDKVLEAQSDLFDTQDSSLQIGLDQSK